MRRRALVGLGRRLSTRVEQKVDAMESLIPTTLAELDADTGDSAGLKATMAELKKQGQVRLTREEKKKRRRALDAIGVPDFMPFLEERGLQAAGEALTRSPTTILQANVGLYCNQALSLIHI